MGFDKRSVPLALNLNNPTKLILTITMIPSLNWLIRHTNLRVKILVICNHYLARKQQSVGGNRNQGLWKCDEWNGKRTYIMSWCYLYPPRMLLLYPGCLVMMGDCLSLIRKCNFCRDGKKYYGYWSEWKSQVIVTECAQTIVWSGVQ